MIPPINIIAFILLPIYLLIKDTQKLEKFNRAVCSAVYFPIGLILTVFFFTSCCLMIPLAYLKVVF